VELHAGQVAFEVLERRDGAPAEDADTVNPSGARMTSLLWLIQTCCVDAAAQQRARRGHRHDVRPNSLPPVLATSPPSDCAIAWNRNRCRTPAPRP